MDHMMTSLLQKSLSLAPQNGPRYWNFATGAAPNVLLPIGNCQFRELLFKGFFFFLLFPQLNACLKIVSCF